MLSDDYEAVQRVRSENGLGALSRNEWDHFENTPHRAAWIQQRSATTPNERPLRGAVSLSGIKIGSQLTLVQE